MLSGNPTLRYKVFMKTVTTAAVELALIAPAALFMTSLVTREITPLPVAAHVAQQIVLWYAGRMWTLWGLLLALPFAALITGCFALRRTWNQAGAQRDRAGRLFAAIAANLETLVVAAATLAAGVILAIVVLHMAAN